ncbi:DUF7674 family protein [Pirellulaceae bacterium SH467]|jgi:hypothetical protein
MTFRTEFLDWARDAFPELEVEFQRASAQSRLYSAFLAFRNHTQSAIDNQDSRRVVELFGMADRVLACSYPEMRSLFHVVFVEDLKFHDERTKRSWALKLLSPSLRWERERSLPGLPRDQT